MSRKPPKWGTRTLVHRVGPFTFTTQKRRAKRELHYTIQVPATGPRTARPGVTATGHFEHLPHRCVIPAAPPGARWACDLCGRRWWRGTSRWRRLPGRNPVVPVRR